MELGLAGKKALVTGGTRGIGRGIVCSLARAGVDVMTCYRDEGGLAATLERELAQIGGTHHVLRSDIGDPRQAAALVAAAQARFGQLDLIVSNASVVTRSGYAELSTQEWQRHIDTNLTAIIFIIRKALPLLNTGASVIGIGSRGAEVGMPLMSHYAATKAALPSLHCFLARELGAKQIRVNVLVLGMVATEALDEMPADQAASLRARFASQTALGRLGTPDDVTGAVMWLASDLSRYVTGTTIHVDGALA